MTDLQTKLRQRTLPWSCQIPNHQTRILTAKKNVVSSPNGVFSGTFTIQWRAKMSPNTPFGREIRIRENRNIGFQPYDLPRCTWDNSRLLVKWNDCKITVKASTFGPHGNLGPFSPQVLASCYHENASYRTMNGIEVVDKLYIRGVGSVHLLENSPKEAPDRARNGQKFPWGP